MKKSYVAVQYTGDAKDTMKLKKKVYLFKISTDGEKTRTSSCSFPHSWPWLGKHTHTERKVDIEGVREVDSPGAQDHAVTLHSGTQGEGMPEVVYEPIAKDGRVYKSSFSAVEVTHRRCPCEWDTM